MIRFGWRGGFSCLVVGMLVGDAVAQNPTISLIPSAFATRKCTGGPEQGDACSNAADCESTALGVVHPECERVCQGGTNDGEPCATLLDCEFGLCFPA